MPLSAGWHLMVYSILLSFGPRRCQNEISRFRPIDDIEHPLSRQDVASKLLDQCFGLDMENIILDDRIERLAGLIDRSSQLSCQFGKDSFDSCCYGNELIRGRPEETLFWSLAEGAVNKQRFRRCFGTAIVPRQGFLVATSEIAGVVQRAQLHSCSIVCAKSIIVRVRQWQRNTIFNICQRGSFDLEPDEWSCKKLKRSEQGDLTRTDLPGGEFIEVVVIAEISKNGIAIIDDIAVTIVSCGEDSSELKTILIQNDTSWMENCTEVTTASGGSADNNTETSVECEQLALLKAHACKKIACDFDAGNPCSWTPIPNRFRSHAWQVTSGPIGNLQTGVDHPADDSEFYIGSLLDPRSGMVLKLPHLNLTRMDGWAIRFSYWFSTYHAGVSVFLNGVPTAFEHLHESTTVSKLLPFHGWRVAMVPLDRNIDEISIIAINSGPNYGAIGIDEIDIIRTDYGTAIC